MQTGRNECFPRACGLPWQGQKRWESTAAPPIGWDSAPTGVPALLQGRTIDFAFIDGGHFGEQPLRDVDAVLPFLPSERFLLVFHDTQCDAVSRGVHYAVQQTGGRIDSIHTRNRLATV